MAQRIENALKINRNLFHIWSQRKHFLTFISQLSLSLPSDLNLVNVVRVNVRRVLELEEMKREITKFLWCNVISKIGAWSVSLVVIPVSYSVEEWSRVAYITIVFRNMVELMVWDRNKCRRSRQPTTTAEFSVLMQSLFYIFCGRNWTPYFLTDCSNFSDTSSHYTFLPREYFSIKARQVLIDLRLFYFRQSFSLERFIKWSLASTHGIINFVVLQAGQMKTKQHMRSVKILSIMRVHSIDPNVDSLCCNLSFVVYCTLCTCGFLMWIDRSHLILSESIEVILFSLHDPLNISQLR